MSELKNQELPLSYAELRAALNELKAKDTELAEAKGEVAACLKFLRTELHWEGFRVEQLYFDKEEKKNSSERNAQLLKNFLAESGHGIAFVTELAAKEARIAELEQQKVNFADTLRIVSEQKYAAEKSLGAVSEVLKEELPESILWGEAYWYRALEVDKRNRRLRSIVEGK